MSFLFAADIFKKMKPDAVCFLPLGGCGIFGANMALYGYGGKWIMADCGMGFADDTMPGVDILLPDPAFAESLGDDLLGIILTHGHEDHIGAIQHLWPRLKAPLYATAFTAARIRQALSELPWGNQVRLHEVEAGGAVKLGPFSARYIRMAHSIPEANALAIAVEGVGTLLHTGDWKIDPHPVEGNLTDEQELKKLGDAGVLAVMGDSTNAMVPGHSGSEKSVQDSLIELFGEFGDSKIVISCFSTNVARLRSIYTAAEKNRRHVSLVGRSLWQVNDAARNTGYLRDIPPFLNDDEARSLPASRMVYVCTGSQGEPRAALSRIAAGEHPAVKVVGGDVVIFSSRAIPGNDRDIERIKNRLYAIGATVITDRDAPVHVSGHPYREELKQFYGWARPKIAIPVHGERMQQERHADLARECGVGHALVPVNGQAISIGAGGAEVLGEVPSGILAIEGGRIVAEDHEAILTRKRIMWNGSAVVTVVVDGRGDLLAEPKITALGLLDENNEIDSAHLQGAVKAVVNAVRNLPKDIRRDDAALSEAARLAARKFFQEKFDRKPQTRVHLVRV